MGQEVFSSFEQIILKKIAERKAQPEEIPEHKGKMLVDATVCEQAIRYPTDIKVLNEAGQILKTDSLRESEAEFLIAVGKMDEAEVYLIKRADQLDGNYYGSLLVSILERGYTKAYPHGIRYLKKLDKLAKSVADWKE